MHGSISSGARMFCAGALVFGTSGRPQRILITVNQESDNGDVVPRNRNEEEDEEFMEYEALLAR